MNVYEEAKYRDFQTYFRITNHIVLFNGAIYILKDSNGNTLTQARTNEEMYSYIAGYLNCYNEMNREIEKLQAALDNQIKLNNDNVAMYEKLIKANGIESMYDENLIGKTQTKISSPLEYAT